MGSGRRSAGCREEVPKCRSAGVPEEEGEWAVGEEVPGAEKKCQSAGVPECLRKKGNGQWEKKCQVQGRSAKVQECRSA
jgi:hypothetical protein